MEQQWEGLTFSGTLPVGVFYAGKRHRDYVLRLGLSGDVIDAQAENPAGSMLLIALDLFRRQLLRLGDIPAEAITLDLLRQGLAEIDHAELERADGELTKKLTLASNAAVSGDASNTPSSDTAIASTTSDA